MSVLTDIKKQLGIIEEDDSFDKDILLDINLAMGILHQIGACDEVTNIAVDTEWDGLFNEESILQLAKAYMYLKVRLLFDPPTNASLLKSFEEQASEYEWRIYAVNNKKE